MQAQRDLAQVALALRPTRGLAGLLHGRQQQRDQQRNDRNHDQQLDQRKAAARGTMVPHGAVPNSRISAFESGSIPTLARALPSPS